MSNPETTKTPATETIQFQIDTLEIEIKDFYGMIEILEETKIKEVFKLIDYFKEVKLKKVLNLVDVLKTTYSIEEHNKVESIPLQIDYIGANIRGIFALIEVIQDAKFKEVVNCKLIDVVKEIKLKDVLDLIDVLKRTYCINELPNALSNDLELNITIKNNEKVCNNHENALVQVENFQLKNLNHICLFQTI